MYTGKYRVSEKVRAKIWEKLQTPKSVSKYIWVILILILSGEIYVGECLKT